MQTLTHDFDLASNHDLDIDDLRNEIRKKHSIDFMPGREVSDEEIKNNLAEISLQR